MSCEFDPSDDTNGRKKSTSVSNLNLHTNMTEVLCVEDIRKNLLSEINYVRKKIV